MFAFSSRRGRFHASARAVPLAGRIFFRCDEQFGIMVGSVAEDLCPSAAKARYNSLFPRGFMAAPFLRIGFTFSACPPSLLRFNHDETREEQKEDASNQVREIRLILSQSV